MSKFFIYDFECVHCGHVFEDMQHPDNNVAIRCVECDMPSKRLITGTRLDWLNMGVSNDYPTCADKWEKSQRQRAKMTNHES